VIASQGTVLAGCLRRQGILVWTGVEATAYAVSPSLNRTNRGTAMFSPIFAIAC
jgi:hypothetical protein